VAVFFGFSGVFFFDVFFCFLAMKTKIINYEGQGTRHTWRKQARLVKPSAKPDLTDFTDNHRSAKACISENLRNPGSTLSFSTR
jgi:hypothetical protein